MSTDSAPSRLRAPLVARSFRPWSPRSVQVILAIAAGVPRPAAARAAGLHRANARVIELRARRRGLLPAIDQALLERALDIDAVIKAWLLAHPGDSNGAVGRRFRTSPARVRRARAAAGLPARRPGRDRRSA